MKTFNTITLKIKRKSTFIYLILGFVFFISNLYAQENYLPLVGSWPYGKCSDVKVVENIAYMGNGSVFQAYDVTDKTSPALLGEVELPALIDKIVIHNNLAFVVIDDQNMQILDISDPENPVLLGLLERQYSKIVSILPGSNNIYLLLTGYIEVIDVSDPNMPVEIEVEFFDSGIKEGKMRDNLVFAANSQIGLQIFDVTDPANMVKVSELALGDTTEVKPYSIEIRDNYAFLGFGGTGLAIVDISDPANPVQVALINSPRDYAYDSHIALNGNYLYLADEGYGEFYIYDISDVENPQELYKSDRAASIRSLKINENYMYIARDYYASSYYTGLQILSIADPVSPADVTVIATPSSAAGMDIFEEKNEAYLKAHNVFVLDITDKTKPTTKAVINIGTLISDFTIIDNYMYVAMDKEGFGIYDITDPETPQLVGHYDVSQFGSGQFSGAARAVTVKDNYAIVAIGYAGLIVLDISNKTDPQLVSYFSELDGHGMIRDGDYLYVSEFVFGRYIVDISDPANTTIVSDPEEFERPGGFFVRDNYAYLADTTFYVFDISDKSNPVEISSIHTGIRGSISVLDHKAYIFSSNKDSLFIYDVTDPNNPFPMESVGFTFDGYATLTRDYIYTSARNEGVRIYKNELVPTLISSAHEKLATDFSLVQNYPNPFNPTTVISYTLGKPGPVELTVYNELGRTVQTLVKDYRQAGHYSVQFDGHGLSSGIYFVKLLTNSHSQVKKMMLIK